MVSLDFPFKDFIEALQRWRKFSGKKIRIITVEESEIKLGFNGEMASILKRITEGKIESIFEVPPGILLKDVKEYRTKEDIHPTKIQETKDRSRSIEVLLGDEINIPKRFIPFKELGIVDFIE